jgi:hypothetical protein
MIKRRQLITARERRRSRTAVLSQAGAPLSWTNERRERGRQWLTSASLSERSEEWIESEQTRFSSASNDEVGGFRARCANAQSKRTGGQR